MLCQKKKDDSECAWLDDKQVCKKCKEFHALMKNHYGMKTT